MLMVSCCVAFNSSLFCSWQQSPRPCHVAFLKHWSQSRMADILQFCRSTFRENTCNCCNAIWTHWGRVTHKWVSRLDHHWSPVNSPHKGQWRGALMFSFICAWINGWVNNCEAGGLRRHRAHCDVTVMICVVRANVMNNVGQNPEVFAGEDDNCLVLEVVTLTSWLVLGTRGMIFGIFQ